MSELVIQPKGGFAGAGALGHVTSEGRIALSALSPEDQKQVLALFARPHTEPGNFSYHIVLHEAAGDKTVDVPADAVPPALLATIQTDLK